MSIQRTLLITLCLGAFTVSAWAADAVKPDKVTIDKVPAVVKDAITKAAAGAAVADIEVTGKDAKAVYAVTLKGADGKDTVVKFDAEGKVVPEPKVEPKK